MVIGHGEGETVPDGFTEDGVRHPDVSLHVYYNAEELGVRVVD